jgi:enoyl-CoA hydratase
VVFGQVLDGSEAERVGLVYRCVAEEQLIEQAQAFARGAASSPRELAIVTKQTIRDMAAIDTHDAAVERELEPQLWSVQKPWFEERVAALKARISSKT